MPAILGSSPSSGVIQSSVFAYFFASDDVNWEIMKKYTVFGPLYLKITKYFCIFSLHF